MIAIDHTSGLKVAVDPDAAPADSGLQGPGSHGGASPYLPRTFRGPKRTRREEGRLR